MLGAILAGAGALGKLFGGAGGGAAAERERRNQFVQQENNRAAQLYGTQQQALMQLLGLDESALLNRARIGLDAPNQRTRQALLGSILERLQPTQVQAPAGIRMGQISGGLRGALGGPGAQQAGRVLQEQALRALMDRSDVPAQVNYASRGMLPPPAMQKYKSAGRGESLMSALGIGGGIAGLLGGLGVGKKKTPAVGNFSDGGW